MGDKEIYKRGIATRFSSTRQPAKGKAGRKPNILKKLKAIGLSHEDIRAVLENLLLADKKKAQELLADPELPLLAVGYLSALLSDIKRGDSATLENIMDRLDGKAAQKLQAETTIRNAQPPVIIFGDEPETAETAAEDKTDREED